MNKKYCKPSDSSAELNSFRETDRLRSKNVWEKNLFPININTRSRINWTNGRMLATGAKSISLNTDLREINSNFKLKRLLQKESRLQKLQLRDHDLSCRGRSNMDKLFPVTSNLQELELEFFDILKAGNNLAKLIYRLKYCTATLKSLQLVLNTESLTLDSVKILAFRLRQMSNLERLSLAIYAADLTPIKFRVLLAAAASLKKLKVLTLKMKNLPTVSATAIVLNLSNSMVNFSKLEALCLSFKCCHYWSEAPFSLLTTAISQKLPLLKYLSIELSSLRFEMTGADSYLEPLRQLNQLKSLRLELSNLKNFSNREMKHIAAIIQSQAFLQDLSLELGQLPLIPASSWGTIISSLEALVSPRTLNFNLDLVPKGRIKSFSDLDIDQLTKIIIKQGWTNLEYLRLSYRNDHNNRPQLIDNITSVLKFLPYLKELCLNLQLPEIYTDESLVRLSSAIDGLEHLQELEFTLPKSRNISHEGLAKMAVTIGKKIRLKALHLNLTNPSKTCENEKFFDVLRDSLVGLPDLQNLSLLLTRISINDDSCSRFSKALSQLKNLESFLWSLTYGVGP